MKECINCASAYLTGTRVDRFADEAECILELHCSKNLNPDLPERTEDLGRANNLAESCEQFVELNGSRWE